MLRKVTILIISFLILIFSQAYGQEVIDISKEIEVTGQSKDLVYYPVPFIPVLKDLRYDSDKSALLKTGAHITGMLVFKGNYSSKSLVEFYRVQMKNQGWEEVGSFSSKITFIAFSRPEGQAFVAISEGFFLTELRIVVILKTKS